MMWIPREIEQVLGEAAGSRPAVMVTGSRQAGKTSLLTRAFPGHTYVSLDLPVLAERAERSGGEFLAAYPPPAILDEVQHAPALLRHVKADIDAHRDETGRFLITGSQRFLLMQGVAESLAGRCSIVELHSLSGREIASSTGGRVDRRGLLDLMFAGGYPELHARGLDPVRWFSDYVATYLERDVRSLLNVRSLRDFDRFLRLCASRTGQLVSYSSIASDVGVSPNTVRGWFSVLEASCVVLLVEPYYENLGKRVVKSPKLYFLDTGLACFLAGMRGPDDLERSSLLGAMFETHVLGQMVRRQANRGLPVSLYFYRDRQGREVDFVIPAGGRFHLVECKWTESPPSRLRGFEEFRAVAGPDAIASMTVVTPDPGRPLEGGVSTADAIAMDFVP